MHDPGQEAAASLPSATGRRSSNDLMPARGSAAYVLVGFEEPFGFVCLCCIRRVPGSVNLLYTTGLDPPIRRVAGEIIVERGMIAAVMAVKPGACAIGTRPDSSGATKPADSIRDAKIHKTPVAAVAPAAFADQKETTEKPAAPQKPERVAESAPTEVAAYLSGRLVLLAGSGRQISAEAMSKAAICHVPDSGVAVVKPGRFPSLTDVDLIGYSRSGQAVVASTLHSLSHPALVRALEPRSALSRADESAVAPVELELDAGYGKTQATATPVFASPAAGILVSLAPIRQRVPGAQAIRKPAFIAGAFVLYLILVLWLILQRRLVGPVTQLTDMSDRILRGDIQVVFRKLGNTAVSRIGRVFNHAFGGLRGYRESMESQGRDAKQKRTIEKPSSCFA